DKICDLETDKKELVGVFGKTGAGKSSLINAVIGEKNLLPSGSISACTTVMIKVEANMQSKKYEGHIEFITKEEWKDELWSLFNFLGDNADQEDTQEDDDDYCDTVERLTALYGEEWRNKSPENLMDNKYFREITEFLDSKRKILTCESATMEKENNKDRYACRRLDWCYLGPTLEPGLGLGAQSHGQAWVPWANHPWDSPKWRRVGLPSSRLTTRRKVHEECGLGSSRGRGPRRPNPWTKTLAIGTWNVTSLGGRSLSSCRRLRVAPGVDEIRPEYLKSLDVVGLSWLTRLCKHCMEVGDSASGVANLGWWSLFLKRGTGECVPTTGGSHFSASPKEGLHQGTGEENLADSPYPRILEEQCSFFVPVMEHWTSSIPSMPNQSTCALWIWRRHSTESLVVFCGGAPRVCIEGSRAKGGLVSVQPEQELGSHCRQISRRSQGPEGVRFGNHRISSLLFADDVVLLASSSQDLSAYVLERFAAECEAAEMRISTSKSWRPWFLTGKGWCALFWVNSSSGGVQVSLGLVHE
ncbi:hypothetical protein L3Q82_014194, partial [Scortum barcoo]